MNKHNGNGTPSNRLTRPLKVTVVGDGNVGKTSLLISYTLNAFPEDYIPTVFEHHQKNVSVDGTEFGLCLWDTAGQETYDKLRPLSYPKTDCFILCYSIISRSSLANAEFKWYPELKNNCPNTAIILVGTKADRRSDCQDPVPEKLGKKLKSKLKAHAFIECSAKTRENLDEIFTEAVRAAMKKKKEKSPSLCSLL